jgi:hypothetical protein
MIWKKKENKVKMNFVLKHRLMHHAQGIGDLLMHHAQGIGDY